MQVNVSNIAFGGEQICIMNHGDETIEWNITLFNKMNLEDKTGLEEKIDLFEQINGYWGYISVEKQNKIFDIYKKINSVFSMVISTKELTKKLQEYIAELTELHDLSEVRHWVDFHANIILTNADIPEIFQNENESITRERTYLKEDYKWLISLSIVIRTMIPIWGEYIARTRKETGNTFKEYYAFRLLAKSNLIKSEPMERLRVYVERSIPSDKSIDSAIYGGISSEDFPNWLLRLVVVNRLAIGDIRGVVPNESLIKLIHKFISGKIKSHDNIFMGGPIVDKINEGQNQDGENNLSKLEGYKIKQEIPAGDIAIIGYYLKDCNNLAKKICPDIDLQLVEKCNRIVVPIESKQIYPPQMTLIKWVLKSAIPPRGLMYVKKKLVVNAMGVALAILWHRKHYELAGLLTASEFNSYDDDYSITGTDSRARILKDQLDLLNIYYPYPRKPVGKQKVAKNINPAVESIDQMASDFSEYEWVLNLPEDMVEKVTGNASNKRFPIPYEIKIKIAALAIELASNAFSKGEVNEQRTTTCNQVPDAGNRDIQPTIPTAL